MVKTLGVCNGNAKVAEYYSATIPESSPSRQKVGTVVNSSFDFEYKIIECRLSLVRCWEYLPKIDSNERHLAKRRLTLVENYKYTIA
ncbi:hypothetical protein M0802_000529 [Mischocyttarus mexicanus]|nr:hypothetical protein M0802_000529 [Mischocyttarus mexicanus]